MYTSLNPGAIGIRANLEEGLALAQRHGFDALNPDIVEVTKLAEREGVAYVRQLFAQHGLRDGDWGMPVDFRRDEAKWQAGLALLPRYAAVAAELGWDRTATWTMPFSDELPFAENLAFHVRRLRPIAEILRDHQIRFGLEYVGPATLRAGHKFTFIHDQAGWQQLRDAIGTDNIGLLLDAFHWYVSGSTVADLKKLRNEDIVTTHMNDAIAGVPRDEQLDQVRCLPGESGVIDLTTFLKTLQEIGYDGPLMVEPFSKRLRELSPDQATHETAVALRRSLQAAGIH